MNQNDHKLFKYVTDITSNIDREMTTFSITFSFEENKYLSVLQLSKTFNIEIEQQTLFDDVRVTESESEDKDPWKMKETHFLLQQSSYYNKFNKGFFRFFDKNDVMSKFEIGKRILDVIIPSVIEKLSDDAISHLNENSNSSSDV